MSLSTGSTLSNLSHFYIMSPNVQQNSIETTKQTSRFTCALYKPKNTHDSKMFLYFDKKPSHYTSLIFIPATKLNPFSGFSVFHSVSIKINAGHGGASYVVIRQASLELFSPASSLTPAGKCNMFHNWPLWIQALIKKDAIMYRHKTHTSADTQKSDRHHLSKCIGPELTAVPFLQTERSLSAADKSKAVPHGEVWSS